MKLLIICQLINCYQTVNSDSEKNRNTILQLLTILNEWTEALDDGIQIDTVYLDFRKNTCNIQFFEPFTFKYDIFKAQEVKIP